MTESNRDRLNAPNMIDIARAAGVSQSTVSRVLNGSPSRVPIASETQRRVLEMARSMGYRPNPLARGLRGAGTATLGLIVREISDPFFARAIEVIVAEARRRHFNVVLGHARSSGHEALVLAGVLETRQCDGIILLGDLRSSPNVWADLIKSPIPVVAVCEGPRSPGIPTVNTDNRLGVTMALDYLFSLGHRRIGYIDAGWIGDIGERRDTYTDFIAAHQLNLPDGYHQPAQNDIGAAEAALRRMLDLQDPPTAIFCATDQVAMGALAAALRAGVRVPEEISVVGFDDIPMAQHTVPPLTTVRQPLEEMARKTVDEILALIRGENTGDKGGIRRVAPTLKVRESSAPPRSGPLRRGQA
jgi:DNA-binding LacI/PurR family transcriptional regulator